MAGNFKRLRGTNKSYIQQGEIFFACRNYPRQQAKTRSKIDRIIERAGNEKTRGDYRAALREYLITDASFTSICDKYFMAPSTLDRVRRRFYEMW